LWQRDPTRVELELAKLGITIGDLVRAGVRDPVLAPELQLLTGEAKKLRVLEWFADEGHPRPEHQEMPAGVIAPSSRAWVRIPPLSDDEPPVQQPNLTRPLPPLPPDVNLFRFSSIQRGARLFDDGNSINQVADKTIFNLHDASRLRWMLARGFFRYEGRLLPPDWRVAQVGKQYAFRFLDEAAWKWVDPAEAARGTGRTPG
jgi:hypothetical protein